MPDQPSPDPLPPATPLRILVTGSAGAVGKCAIQGLQSRGHHLRGFDRVPTPDLADHVVGDLADAAAVSAAVTGCDAIVHLAAVPDDADFMTLLLPNNIVGTYHVFEAARAHGVKRLVVASTGQVASGDRKKPPPRRASDLPTPTNHYAVTKVFAEAMGVMYHERYQMDVIMARIGWLIRNADEATHMIKWPGGKRIYLSHADAAQFFVKAIETPQVGYLVTFVTSRSPGETVFDLTPAQTALGFAPQHTYPEGLPESWPRG